MFYSLLERNAKVTFGCSPFTSALFDYYCLTSKYTDGAEKSSNFFLPSWLEYQNMCTCKF